LPVSSTPAISAATKVYTASAYGGASWFDQLFWLGVNRAPAGWHKWTFDFDAEAGLQVLHNDKEVNAIDSAKTSLKGFSAIAFWGDDGKGDEQSIWVANLTVSLGGPVKVIPTSEADPYAPGTVKAEAAGRRPVVIYMKDNAPPVPTLEALPLQESVSQYGITWTLSSQPTSGNSSTAIGTSWPGNREGDRAQAALRQRNPKGQLDPMDKERPEDQRVRNGFMVNPPAQMRVAYDSGVRNWFDPSLIQKLPVTLKPGDSMIATISMPKGLILHAQLRNNIERGGEDCSPIRTAAVLTCLDAPQPPDAFRPAFCDRQGRIYLARNLKRQSLPTAAATKSLLNVQQYIRFTQRPWVGTCFFGFEEPVENMPQYGLEYGRVAGLSALLLCADLKPAEKEPLLINLVQVGIDLGGMVRAGHPGGPAGAGTAVDASCPSSSPGSCWAMTSWPTSISHSPR